MFPDYPKALEAFYGRRIWTDWISSFAADETKWKAGFFIKPKSTKAFTGKIVRSIKDLIGCGCESEDYEIYVSEPLDIAAEWRCFICRDEILGVRPYAQNAHQGWKYHYDPKVLEDILEAFKTWQGRPAACAIDICVTRDGRTLVVEVNDAYSLGSYGLEDIFYAHMISARWAQIMGRKDEYDF